MKWTRFDDYCYIAKIVLIEFDGTLAHYQVKGYTKNPDHKRMARILFNEYSSLKYAGVEYIEICGERFVPQELINN